MAALSSTPRRFVHIARKLLPRLAEQASPTRLLSAMLREIDLVIAEEVALACSRSREGSSSSSWSAQAGADGLSPAASWGQLTSENVQIHEERSSPVAVPELLALVPTDERAAVELDECVQGEVELHTETESILDRQSEVGSPHHTGT